MVLLTDKTRALGCDPAACSNELVCPGEQVDVDETILSLLNLLGLLKY